MVTDPRTSTRDDIRSQPQPHAAKYRPPPEQLEFDARDAIGQRWVWCNGSVDRHRAQLVAVKSREMAALVALAV